MISIPDRPEAPMTRIDWCLGENMMSLSIYNFLLSLSCFVRHGIKNRVNNYLIFDSGIKQLMSGVVRGQGHSLYDLTLVRGTLRASHSRLSLFFLHSMATILISSHYLF